MLPRALIALVTVLLLTSCGSGGEDSTRTTSQASTPAPSRGRSDAVTIDNFKFAPATLDVKSGAVVTVTNADSTAHTATADGGAFDTGDIDPGASKTITLGEAGRVTYHCQIHPFMKATIVVS